ncbi:MAG: hypothetical protein WAM09_16545 [Anaerolineales bacterium]|jgi:hypothetical protein
MSEIAIQTIKITTTGGAGVAVGSENTTLIKGFLLDVFLNYDAGAPATTDVTISDPVFGDLVVKSDNNTDIWIAPRKQTVGVDSADTGLYDLIPIHSYLTISVAQADALTDCLVATVRWITP